MKWFNRVVLTAGVLALALIALIVGTNLRESLQRSKQKQTMATMRDAGIRYEASLPIGDPVDAWGAPMQVRIRGGHYTIRAAMSDGVFEKSLPRRVTDNFADDVVFSDGVFLQFPGGL